MNYKRPVNDNSMHGSLSEEDKKILLDALHFDCDALLTVDRFARDQNKKVFIFRNYSLMILTPLELMKITKPYQVLCC